MRLSLQIGRGDVEVVHGSDGWAVYNSHTKSFVPTEKRILVLLPLLEQPIEQVRASLMEVLHEAGIPGESVKSFPFEKIIRLALAWPTDYWVGLALDWLDALGSVRGYEDLLAAIEGKKHFPQKMRHRASRMLGLVKRRQ